MTTQEDAVAQEDSGILSEILEELDDDSDLVAEEAPCASHIDRETVADADEQDAESSAGQDSGEAQAEPSSEAVQAEPGSGEAQAEQSSGEAQAEQSSGEAQAEQSSGEAQAEQSSGEAQAEQSSGEAQAEQSSEAAQAEQSSGEAQAEQSSGEAQAEQSSEAAQAEQSSGEAQAEQSSEAAQAEPGSGGAQAEPGSEAESAEPGSGEAQAEQSSEAAQAEPGSGGAQAEQSSEAAQAEPGSGGAQAEQSSEAAPAEPGSEEVLAAEPDLPDSEESGADLSAEDATTTEWLTDEVAAELFQDDSSAQSSVEELSAEWFTGDAVAQESVTPAPVPIPLTEESVTPAPVPIPPTEESVTPAPVPIPPTEEPVTPAPVPIPPTEESVTPAPAPMPPTEEPVPPRAVPVSVPSVVSKYRLLGELGRGTLCNVYEGQELEGSARVAVKLLRKDSPQISAEGGVEAAKRVFFREARIISRMKHPHILCVIDSGEEGEHSYIITELVEESHTLRQHAMAGHLLPPDQTASIIFQCAQALAHVHRQGITHCDVKPENILLLPGGFVKIADFGIAIVKDSDDILREEASGDILGSPRYMSPEQLRSKKLSYKTDLFSLGIVFYEMLTGHHPFHADDLESLIQKIINDDPPSLDQYVPDLLPGLQSVIDTALQKKEKTRYTSGSAMAMDIARLYPELQVLQTSMEVDDVFRAVRSLGFFAEFEDQELVDLVQSCESEAYEEGMEIIREGTVMDSSYILFEGYVELKKGKARLGRLSPGSCFGEMGYLTGIRRTATVKAVSNCQVLKLNATLVGRQPEKIQLKLSEAFIRVLVQRLEHTTRILTSLR